MARARKAPCTADPARVVAVARSWIGTPYHDQASAKGAGCDCLGLARGVWREVVGAEPGPLPTYGRDWGETSGREVLLEGARAHMIEVLLAAVTADTALAGASAGALILFRMQRGAVAKHCGILTGIGTMIHAYERLGVVEVPFTTAWSRRAAAAFLFPARPPVRAVRDPRPPTQTASS
jgi:NlpC/P60 family putative phage cell wall peptidase